MHGHGKHILKQQTPLWLAQHPHVMAFHQAPKEYGGDAALLVLIEVDEWLPPELPWIFKGGRVCPFSLEYWRLNPGDNERNNRALIEKRKQLSDSLLWANGIAPSEGLEDDDLLQALIDELLTLVDGYLAPFAPVMANILKNWMTAWHNGQRGLMAPLCGVYATARWACTGSGRWNQWAGGCWYQHAPPCRAVVCQ